MADVCSGALGKACLTASDLQPCHQSVKGNAMVIQRLVVGVATMLAACVAPTPGPSTQPQFLRGADWAPDANPPYSAAVVHGDTVYLAGTLGFTPGTRDLPAGIDAQAANALAAIEANLAGLDLSLSDLVTCTCYLADMDDYRAFNAVYAGYFPTNPPARTTIGVAALPLGAAVEITCTAALA
ncbi:MAG: RidA family protein [Pseudomonadota bacterium]